MARKISVVLPIFNEESVIEALAEEIEAHLDAAVEFVFVNDGSTDGTLELLKAYRPGKEGNSRKVVVLTRSFGQQNAIMAGLSSVSPEAEAIVVMDSDFQDKPNDIVALLAKLDEGHDCVYAVRTANSGSLIVNFLTALFYRAQKMLFSFAIPEHAGTFSVFTREFLGHLLKFGEREVYFPAVRAYIGMKQAGVPVERGSRSAGKSKVGFFGLVNLAMSGLLSFSALPMRAIFIVGVVMTFLCLLLGVTAFVLKVTGVTQIPGVTTVLILMLGLFGVLTTFIGLMGEYVGKLFLESKGRPRWLVKDVIDDP